MPGIQLLALYFFPESPRFLISRGRDAEAKKILVHYHANGVANDPFVNWEFAEIRDTLQLEREAAAESGWLEMVRTPGNRKRCALIILTAIFSQCSGNGLVSYYLAQILKTIGITEYVNTLRFPPHPSSFSFSKARKSDVSRQPNQTIPHQRRPDHLVLARESRLRLCR
jgi:Sugar (and other) transporter